MYPTEQRYLTAKTFASVCHGQNHWKSCKNIPHPQCHT